MPTQGFFIREIIIMTKHKLLKDAERIFIFINYKLKECSLPFEESVHNFV